jgi:hypothetical protein
MTGEHRGMWPVVLCRTDKGGLVLQARREHVALRFRLESQGEPDEIAFPGQLLSEIEGRDKTPVILETLSATRCQARWLDAGVARMCDFDMVPPDRVPNLPEPPRQMQPMQPEFLTALAHAAATAATESVRYALQHIQLRGQAGEVVATDGHQLLLQNGFSFPWPDDILVPALPIFCHRDMPREEPCAVGRTKSDVALRIGPWTFLLALDGKGRFPNARQVIPKPKDVTTKLQLDPQDVATLVEVLPRLPSPDDEQDPVTIDLHEPPAVRACGEGGTASTEVLLARSSVVGPPVRLCTNRQYLRRALQLGFTELQIVDANQPLCCRDGSRCYLWVPLKSEGAIPKGSEVRQIAGPEQPPVTPSPIAPPRREEPMPPVPMNGDNGHDNGTPLGPPAQRGIGDLIAEAESLRDLLHHSCARASRLVAALKHQRRQARAVQQAMASLKQLQFDH